MRRIVQDKLRLNFRSQWAIAIPEANRLVPTASANAENDGGVSAPIVNCGRVRRVFSTELGMRNVAPQLRLDRYDADEALFTRDAHEDDSPTCSDSMGSRLAGERN